MFPWGNPEARFSCRVLKMSIIWEVTLMRIIKLIVSILLYTYSLDAVSSKILTIGVSGGSGSGKTTLINNLAKALKGKDIVVLSQDAYYRDLSHLTPEQRARRNYDDPEAIEFSKMTEHLSLLKNGHSINQPIYDFTTHTRKQETKKVQPEKIILVEGILIFTHAPLLDLFDFTIFVDVPADERLLRRIKRDMTVRKRSLDSIITQYKQHVAPMYLKHILPSKKHADVIVPQGGKQS